MLHVERRGDGQWDSTLETGETFAHPEANIAALLDAIAALTPRSREMWDGCTVREFKIGYDCGSAPRAVDHGLTTPTLARMAILGIGLRITLYPAA